MGHDGLGKHRVICGADRDLVEAVQVSSELALGQRAVAQWGR